MSIHAQYASADESTSGNNNLWPSTTHIMGLSFLATLFQAFRSGNDARGTVGGSTGSGGPSSYLADSMRLFLVGTIIEGGRRFFGWFIERFKLFQYSITAQFTEGDPVYEWIILLLTEERIWSRSRQFNVTSASSIRQWAVKLGPHGNVEEGIEEDHVEYVPTYQAPQLFRWKGYWAEVRRQPGNGNRIGSMNMMNGEPGQTMGDLFLTLYTRDMGALSSFIEEARQRYVKTSQPHVTVYTINQGPFRHRSVWDTVKRKSRRPLSSIILQEGVIHSLMEDAREFLRTKQWYVKAGIPHRRGYLLYGPPGTGKTSTIYGLAGELGLEIYSISLASGFVDDAFLSRAAAAIPKQAIFLIEDIDCAFPSREDEDASDIAAMGMGRHTLGLGGIVVRPGRQHFPITLSGLLNVLDGVASEEGRIFFATTNYIDRLDPALLRPGRIDKKVQYNLATKAQAAALFSRFYPETDIPLRSEKTSSKDPSLSEKEAPNYDSTAPLTHTENQSTLHILSEQFAAAVPEHEFSTAELQGFLLSCKQQPELAVQGVASWVEQEKKYREEKARRDEKAKEKRRLEMSQLNTELRAKKSVGGEMNSRSIVPRIESVNASVGSQAGCAECGWVPAKPKTKPPTS